MHIVRRSYIHSETHWGVYCYSHVLCNRSWGESVQSYLSFFCFLVLFFRRPYNIKVKLWQSSTQSLSALLRSRYIFHWTYFFSLSKQSKCSFLKFQAKIKSIEEEKVWSAHSPHTSAWYSVFYSINVLNRAVNSFISVPQSWHVLCVFIAFSTQQ